MKIKDENMNKRLLILIILLLNVVTINAQNLETQGGLDAKSVSTAMKDGVSSSRVIIFSNLALSYTTNMGDISFEDIGSDLINGMNVDTIYFYLNPFDSHRRLIIAADGFAPTRIDLKLPPKATYIYTILEPSNASDEFLQRDKQYELGCKYYDSESWVSAINIFVPLAAAGHAESEDKLCQIFLPLKNREIIPVEMYAKFEQEVKKERPYAQFIICTQYFDKYGLLTTNHEELFKMLESAAYGGNSFAQAAVGSAYQAGVGVAIDPFKAVEWYERSATLDNTSALMNLAVMLDGGIGTKADKNRSYELIKRIIDLNLPGCEYAMEMLGGNYAFGKGYEKDSKKAIYWFEKAGNAGVDRAWGWIGLMYLRGILVDQDFNKAAEYITKGVELNDSYAMALMGEMYEEGKGFKADEKRGLNWYKKSADLGDRYGQNFLAHYYFTHKDYKQAWEWNKKSGDNRAMTGYYNMGRMCENRQSPSPYKRKDCIQWYEKAGQFGSSHAIKRLIEIYSKGIYVKKSRECEMKWRVALANVWLDEKALIIVAKAYLNGDGVEMNELEAIKYLERAASLDSKEAMLTLSKLYREGIAVLKDEKLADEWLSKANMIN